jgi:hypothetical protein
MNVDVSRDNDGERLKHLYDYLKIKNETYRQKNTTNQFENVVTHDLTSLFEFGNNCLKCQNQQQSSVFFNKQSATFYTIVKKNNCESAKMMPM